MGAYLDMYAGWLASNGRGSGVVTQRNVDNTLSIVVREAFGMVVIGTAAVLRSHFYG
jgi:hypothetical protein